MAMLWFLRPSVAGFGTRTAEELHKRCLSMQSMAHIYEQERKAEDMWVPTG